MEIVNEKVTYIGRAGSREIKHVRNTPSEARPGELVLLLCESMVRAESSSS